MTYVFDGVPVVHADIPVILAWDGASETVAVPKTGPERWHRDMCEALSRLRSRGSTSWRLFLHTGWLAECHARHPHYEHDCDRDLPSLLEERP